MKKKSELKPDRKTLHKTDPQEEMKGPVSTPLQELEKVFEPGKVPEKKKPERK